MHEWSDFIYCYAPCHGLVVQLELCDFASYTQYHKRVKTLQLELFDGARLSFGGYHPLTRQTAFASPGVR